MRSRKTRVEECWTLSPKLTADGDVGSLPQNQLQQVVYRAMNRFHFGSMVTLGYRSARIDSPSGPAFLLEHVVSYRKSVRRRQVIRIDETDPHLGGTRTWFVCECGRRAAKLYLPHADEARKAATFACRICLDLSYRSAQEAHRDERKDRSLARVLRRAENLLARSRAQYG